VTITKPKPKQKIELLQGNTSKRTPIRFAGKATDKSGVQSVFITVQKISPSQGGSTKCTWLDPTQGLRRTSCSKPIMIKAKLSGSAWRYKVRSSIKLSKGGYRVRAYGLDKTGTRGNSAAQALRNVRFTLR